MPTSSLPLTRYRPPARQQGTPTIKSYSATRSRLTKGGTFFRSKNVGIHQNRLSVEVVEYSSTEAVCVVANDAVQSSENIIGTATASLLRVDLPFTEKIEIYNLHTPQPRARNYSISAQIGAAPQQIGSDVAFSFSKPLIIAGKVTAMLLPTSTSFTQVDKIIIKPRFRLYRLKPVSAVDADTGATINGWDIEDLRQQVNADVSCWVEMPPRGSAYDVHDSGVDAPALTSFGKSFLSGADGLPEQPNNEITGPTRSLIHLNYAEDGKGQMSEVNVVYQWVGDSQYQGSWVPY